MKETRAGLFGGLLLAMIFSSSAGGLATEEIGNKPLNWRNFADWPGIMPVVNHKSRVYEIWVNGGDMLYYRGDTRALNLALADFAEVEAERRFLVLQPGPATVKAFSGDAMRYDWRLQLMGGIARHTYRDSQLLERYPTVTVYVGGGYVDLDELSVPKGLTVLGPGRLHDRCRQILHDGNKHDRGFAAHKMAELAPEDPGSVPLIAALLEDEDVWVRQMAAGALGRMGTTAVSTIPALKQAAKNQHPNIRRSFERAIDQIRSAVPDPEAARQRKQISQRIDAFVARLPMGLLLPPCSSPATQADRMPAG